MPLRNTPTAPLASVPVRRSQVDAAGARTAVWTYGPASAARTIVLVHGFRGTHHGLLPLVAHMPDTRFIAPDLPGFGLSTPLPVEHTLENYATWLHEFLGIVDPEAGATVLGHSFGSLVVAAGVDALAPRDLILVNPISENALSGPERLPTLVAIGYYRAAAALPRTAGETLLRSHVITRVMSEVMATTHSPALRRWIHAQHAAHFSDFADAQTLLEAFRASVSDEVRAHADRFPPGTTLIAGERDVIATEAAARRLHEDMPGSTLHIIAGVGHLIHYEKPIALARLVRQHLAAHPSRSAEVVATAKAPAVTAS